MSDTPETQGTPNPETKAETPATTPDTPKTEYKPAAPETDPTQDNADAAANKALKTIPPTDPTGTGALLDQQINAFVTAVEQQQTSEDLRAKAKTAIFKEGKLREGVKTLWSMLSGGTSRASEVPLPEIDSTTPLEVLQKKIEELNTAIMKTKDFQKKIELVSLFSALKRSLYTKGHNNKKPTEPEMLEHLAQSGQLKIGDVINIRNEKANVLYDKILSRAISSETGGKRTHTAIISKIDPLTMIHADAKGVHEISLQDYANNLSQLDIMIMNTPDDKGVQVMQYAKTQIGKPYDALGMVSKSHGDDSKLFCSELIDKSLRQAGIYQGKSIIAPSETMNILTPSYMGSLV